MTLMFKERRSTRESASSVRYYGDSRCRSIWQWQLVLAVTTVTIAAGVAFLTPVLFQDWRFSAGLVMIVVVTSICLGIPWHRVGASGVIVVPVLDAIAVGLLDSKANPLLAILWVFPVAWVASYYSPYALIGMLALVGGSSLLRLFADGAEPQDTINVVILLITLGFVGVIMLVGSSRSRASKRLLQAQSSRIGHALRRVTEQKSRNRQLLDSLDIGIARVKPGGVIEVSNHAFHTLYALDVSPAFRPTSAVEYRARRGAPIPLSETSIARAARGELFSDELIWLFGLDGQWRALKASTRVIEEDRHASDGLLLLIEDVSTQVDPRANQEQTRRTISHELRNPLTAILGHVDLLLERDDVSETMRRQLEVVERAGDRMERLIDEALVTTPHTAEHDAVEFDLADVAHASIEGFAPVAEAQGVSLKVSLDETLPLRGDAFRLRQVVDNVIGNAIKYAQRGGAVTILATHRDENEVALVVTDTGIGISAEDLPHIFEPEFRAQLARERGIPGTGLGLGISRAIVTEQGGRLDVTSELGQGTEVALVLPSPSERRLS